MTDTILYGVASGVATLTLNRPDKRNAFDDTMIQTLLTHLNSASADPDVRMLVLCAAGKHFSAGADLHWMKRMAAYSAEENTADARALAQLMYHLYHFSKPTLALVHGAVYGGAVGLVACCDSVIASEDATFCLSEVKLGLIPAVIGPYVIAALGARTAKHLMITGEVFNASRACSIGLVQSLVGEPSELAPAGLLLQQRLLSNGPEAMHTIKQFVHELSSRELDDSLIELTATCIAKIRSSKEGQEGLQAFLEKRTPAWSTSDVN